MTNKNVLAVYEDCRSVIWRLEAIKQKIDKLHPQLKTKVNEAFNTAQSDLLIITNFLLDVSCCETDSDLEFLLESQTEINQLID